MGWLDDIPDERKRHFEKIMPDVLAFWQHAAPTLFRWMQWSALLAVVRYAYIKTGAWPLAALQIVACILLWGHLVHFFSDKSTTWKSAAEMRQGLSSWVIGALATAGVFAASLWLAGVFIDNPL